MLALQELPSDHMTSRLNLIIIVSRPHVRKLQQYPCNAEIEHEFRHEVFGIDIYLISNASFIISAMNIISVIRIFFIIVGTSALDAFCCDILATHATFVCIPATLVLPSDIDTGIVTSTSTS